MSQGLKPRGLDVLDVRAEARTYLRGKGKGKGKSKGKGEGKSKSNGEGKSKSNGKGQYRGLSTALRFGRDDGVWGTRAVERA
jgi:hypothetical protein